MPVTKRLTLLFLASLLSCLAFSQDKDLKNEKPERPGWSFGLNLGITTPSSFPANFYNGSSGNDNNLDRILGNKYYKEQIVPKIGYNYLGWESPSAMSYKASMSVGFYVRYEFLKHRGFFAQFNYTKLKANDIFFLELDLPSGVSFDARYLQCPIRGEEERTMIELGYFYEIPLREKILLSIETGLQLTNTKVLANEIMIQDMTFNIKYDGEHPDGEWSTNTRYDIRQGGIGFGVFAGSHLRLLFSEKISFDPGFDLYMQNINLEGYQSFRLTPYFFARIIFHDFFSNEQ